MFKGYVYTSGFICWIIIITALSLYSFEEIDTQEIFIPHLDKVVHFIFYFVASFLGALLIREQTKGQLNLSRAVIISMLVVIIYGIVIEVIGKINCFLNKLIVKLANIKILEDGTKKESKSRFKKK